MKHEVTWPPASGIYQKFYRLEGTIEYLLVDLAVMTVSAPDKFLVGEIHGDAVVFFDKDGTVRRLPSTPGDSYAGSCIGRIPELINILLAFGRRGGFDDIAYE